MDEGFDPFVGSSAACALLTVLHEVNGWHWGMQFNCGCTSCASMCSCGCCYLVGMFSTMRKHALRAMTGSEHLKM